MTLAQTSLYFRLARLSGMQSSEQEIKLTLDRIILPALPLEIAIPPYPPNSGSSTGFYIVH